MRNKLYWGLGILIVLLIGAFVFMMVNTQSEIRQLAADLAKAQKKLEAHNKAANSPNVVDISDVKPPPAEPGFKWVRHGDHWDKIPVEQRETTVEPVKPMYTGPLTYHEELLETHPVEALRLQQEERGHWSAKWVPPFPPDNQEAAVIAKSYYLLNYYRNTGETDTAVYEELKHKILELLAAIDEHPLGAYKGDLLKLTWSVIPEGTIGAGYGPSNYSLPRK